MLALAIPASAATAPASVTSSAILVVKTPFGPVTSCPVNLSFSAAVHPVFAAGARREVQYKWVDGSGVDTPTETAAVPAPAGIAGALAGADVNVSTSRTVGEGHHFVQLQISYPANAATLVNYTVTCPTPGEVKVGL